MIFPRDPTLQPYIKFTCTKNRRDSVPKNMTARLLAPYSQALNRNTVHRVACTVRQYLLRERVQKTDAVLRTIGDESTISSKRALKTMRILGVASMVCALGLLIYTSTLVEAEIEDIEVPSLIEDVRDRK